MGNLIKIASNEITLLFFNKFEEQLPYGSCSYEKLIINHTASPRRGAKKIHAPMGQAWLHDKVLALFFQLVILLIE